MGLEDLQQKLREEVFGKKEHKTLEEALQEALDNSTPEEPGIPNSRESVEPLPEWV